MVFHLCSLLSITYTCVYNSYICDDINQLSNTIYYLFVKMIGERWWLNDVYFVWFASENNVSVSSELQSLLAPRGQLRHFASGGLYILIEKYAFRCSDRGVIYCRIETAWRIYCLYGIVSIIRNCEFKLKMQISLKFARFPLVHHNIINEAVVTNGHRLIWRPAATLHHWLPNKYPCDVTHPSQPSHVHILSSTHTSSEFTAND